MLEICACGHVRGSHLIRWGLPDQVRQAVADGRSACRECECHWYELAVSVDKSERNNFRVRPKAPRGNFGTGHPLVVGLTKVTTAVRWEKTSCDLCESETRTLIALDSRLLCGTCFIAQPEVYLVQVLGV